MRRCQQANDIVQDFPYQQLRSLLLEVLAEKPQGQYLHAVEAVGVRAVKTGLWAPPPGRSSMDGNPLTGRIRDRVAEEVRQLLWQFVVQGLLVPGMNQSNPDWPWYRLTARGEEVAKAGAPQPYDPDGFIAFFDRKNPEADPVVRDYLVEAVGAFNAGCPKAAAVMLGCASEKAILLLVDSFGAAITDPGRKAQFEKDTGGWMIASKYGVLKDRLAKLVVAKKLPKELAETAQGDLDIGFQLVRRQRNAAGHPDIVGHHDPDSVFISLRFMADYVARAQALVDHFRVSPADW